MRIGVLTGGGDAPGLNSLVRALVRGRSVGSEELVGIRRGYGGLVTRDVMHLDEAVTRDWMHEGGSWLGAESQWQPEDFSAAQDDAPGDASGQPASSSDTAARSDAVARGETPAPLQVKGREIPSSRWFSSVVSGIEALAIDVVVAVGGDGTLAVSEVLARDYGVKIIGVPKTIDGDVAATPLTIGFSTAREIVCRSCDEVRASARTHRRTQIIECMGRNSGRLALEAGLAADIDAVVIAEAPTSVTELAQAVLAAHERQAYSVVLVAEGAHWTELEPKQRGATPAMSEHNAGERHGANPWLLAQLKALCGKDSRVLTLGHVQRGAAPSALDRAIAARAASRVLRCVREGEFGVGIALGTTDTRVVPLAEMAVSTRVLRPDDEVVQAAANQGLLLPRGFAQDLSPTGTTAEAASRIQATPSPAAAAPQPCAK